MAEISRAALEAAVREYRDPYLDKDLYELDAVKGLDVDAQGRVSLSVQLPYASAGIAGALRQGISGDGPTLIDIVVTRDPAHMLPGVDNRTVQVKKGDRVA